jgi:hypothetical protein
MRTAKKVIEDIEQLPAKDRRVVLRHLEYTLEEASRGRPSRGGRRRKRPYAALLEIKPGRSGYRDVSSDKYRHLASALKPKTRRK